CRNDEQREESSVARTAGQRCDEREPDDDEAGGERAGDEQRYAVDEERSCRHCPFSGGLGSSIPASIVAVASTTALASVGVARALPASGSRTYPAASTCGGGIG